MKTSTRTPKTRIVKELRKIGVTLTRVTNSDGLRVWRTNRGEEFETLAQVKFAYKLDVA